MRCVLLFAALLAARAWFALLAAFAVLALVAAHAQAADCTATSTGLVPLNDLGAGSYQGESGGLYGGGSNQRPFAHDFAGARIARSIVPLDTLGQPDPVNGRVLLISIGMSNCTQEFSAFITKAGADPMRSSFARAVDCAIGGQAANVINNPNAWYWDSVVTRLRGRGYSPAQVQIVWIKEANASPSGSFATSSGLLTKNLGTIVRILKDRLPNARLAYLTSRIYAGYATTALNPEPYAYESAFAVRRLIQAQMAGEDSLNWDGTQGPAEAPWLAWGPYLWADGLTARSDGLTWACADFAADGTHPATSARNRVADSLLAFFRADDTTKPWYLKPELLDAPGPEAISPKLEAGPVPARDAITFRFSPGAGTSWRLTVYDVTGRVVWRESGEGGRGESVQRAWRPRSSRAAPGVYLAHLVSGATVQSKRVVVH